MTVGHDSSPLAEGQIVQGSQFREPMRVETVRSSGPETWVIGLVGTQSSEFRRVTFSRAEIGTLKIYEPSPSFRGNGDLLRLGIQAHALGIAHEFDPYFGLSISRVDPLPHQLEAVYDYLLKLPRVRFLLADDAGAGKTIMAGLLVRELKLRGLLERILIICPANLTFQWQRELKDKFEEKFVVLKGDDIRDQFGINQWIEGKQVITSLDLAKRTSILPGLKQVHWDLVIVDEAHRMSAAADDKKSLRYKLGELLRDHSDHLLLLTATPHKGDPENFSLFLRLLDPDAFADVRSIKEAMSQRRAPFYLRRTKEAMVYFPEKDASGEWKARKLFMKRIPRTIEFRIDNAEFKLYQAVTQFVKRQCIQAETQGEDPRARAVAFLMTLYQRRLASSTFALRQSLENRVRRLEESLEKAQDLARQAPPQLPDADDLEEMDELDRERMEQILEAITLSQRPELVQAEASELKRLAAQAKDVESGQEEAKLARLKKVLKEQGFFDKPDQRLLIFTEYRDTLDYLAGNKAKGIPGLLIELGFKVGVIHGGMKPGDRETPGTRIHSEQQFRDGATQILVATEAAGEGINLQCCHILFNYDIPWNPNRLEQRMGRIHRYGQTQDCLIFNFVAGNTIEGRVLSKLLEKLQEIRDALDDDAVFNVVGEILPAAYLDRVLRDYYAGKLGEPDLEDRFLKDVKEEKFRAICHNALEGLASKKLNLAMLIERRALAQERRVVPETIARFMQGVAPHVPMGFKPVTALLHAFDPAKTPATLRRYESDKDWRLPMLANAYPRLSADRETADKNHLEWVTPGHPLFEALRRHAVGLSRDSWSLGACFYSVEWDKPARIDFYRARIVDGMGHIVHERLFAVRVSEGDDPKLHEPGVLGNLLPAPVPEALPPIAQASEVISWMNENAFRPFLEEVQKDRLSELERIARHVEISLTELMSREDQLIGRFSEDSDTGVDGSAGNLKQAEDRHAALLARRERRRMELGQQKALTLQAIERLTSVLVLPYPQGGAVSTHWLRPNPVVEAIAMREAMAHELREGRVVTDVHEDDLGYDLRSIDPSSGELRMIEVKGLGAAEGNIILTPNEHRVAEDRRDCYWLYVVTECKSDKPSLRPIRDPVTHQWESVSKVQYFTFPSRHLREKAPE
jgi:superfamily II DNA or RNA helicase